MQTVTSTKRWWRHAAFAVALVGGLHATTSLSFAAAQGSKVILLTVTEECAYCARHLSAFKEEAAKRGLKLEIKITPFDPALQATQVEQAIAERPDGIVLWPADASALVPSIRKIKMAGIPLIISNSMPDKKFSQFWAGYTGPNDFEGGERAGEAMIKGFEEKGLGKEGSIFVIIGVPGTPPQIQRLDGFKKVLSEQAPGIKIAGVQPGNWDQTQATEAASALFAKFGDSIKGVYAEADNMLAGVITAAQRAGLNPSKLVLVGGNLMIEGIKNINEGTQYASVLQSPVQDGIDAADAIADLLDGKKVEPIKYLPNPIITKANLNQFPTGW
jgi:ribose transport system substrate-binding protein